MLDVTAKLMGRCNRLGTAKERREISWSEVVGRSREEKLAATAAYVFQPRTIRSEQLHYLVE